MLESSALKCCKKKEDMVSDEEMDYVGVLG